MAAEIDQWQQRAGERASLGGFESFCDRFEVAAADTAPREGITVTGTGVGSLQLDQAVLSSGSNSAISLIGRVNRTGALAAHVRLISDPGFALTGHFVSYSSADGAHPKDLPALVKGRGEGEMVIDNLPLEDVRSAGLKTGDWVVLGDDQWPRELQGIRIGRIESIQPLPKQPLFALIRLSPEQNMTHLNDVWIMTHHR
jgi:cell shape-determining protein MreC